MAAVERLEALAAVVERAVSDVDTIAAQATGAGERLARSSGDALVGYGAGALLHAFYTEIEKVFQRIARELDGFEPKGEAWHSDLLAEMSLDVAGVRPPVVPETLQKPLHEYLRFRHLFRNLYVLDLDAAKMQKLLAALPVVWQDARASLLGFAATLRQMGRALRGT